MKLTTGGETGSTKLGPLPSEVCARVSSALSIAVARQQPFTRCLGFWAPLKYLSGRSPAPKPVLQVCKRKQPRCLVVAGDEREVRMPSYLSKTIQMERGELHHYFVHRVVRQM